MGSDALGSYSLFYTSHSEYPEAQLSMLQKNKEATNVFHICMIA